MKFDEIAGSTAVATADAPGTRSRVVRSLLIEGPTTAVHLAERLGLTPGAVRRHLDALVDDGSISAGDRAPYGPQAPRGRGRPAKVYCVTQGGRERFAQSYDDLAIDLLRYLRESQGTEAVAGFARTRANDVEARYGEQVAAVEITERPRVLADLLSADGFATSVEAARSPQGGVQICQHHCPVAHVAEEFPELCEAEAEMFSRLLGTHVQRLATIAHGDSVCTTHLPASSRITPAESRNPA